MTSIDQRYPIGKHEPKQSYTSEEVVQSINRIAEVPAKYELAVKGLSDLQLDTPYREGGWTVRQVVHHVADSHTNAYIRIKWALTEDKPIIKAYEEKRWAETPETKLPPSLSLTFLHALHAKIVAVATRLSPNDLAKKFVHPESKKEIRLDQLLGMYAWHGEHHLAHITELKKRMEW
jgi:hypothetical protein